MGYLTPDEVITGIAKKLDNGDSEADIIKTIVKIAETEARQLLRKKGYAPDFKSYAYSPPDHLTKPETNRDRLEWERLQWVNEATHLIGFGDFAIEQAAFTILETEQLSYFLETGQTEKAIISMANLLACGLLHSDQEKGLAIQVLRDRHKKRNGKAKGYVSHIKQYVRKACESLKLDELDPDRAARKIFKLFEEDKGNLIYEEIYQDNETCPIVCIEYDQQEQILHYHAINTPGKDKKLPFKRLTDIIREIRKPKTKKPE